ncbi:hypothetical protein HFU84_02535 [Acidithiobacillus sp. CV18-2]|nr:hypothetical protein [Acidithiobacillus sp. CV18-3]MBU2758154.1 hypothetical protein [Acidithiobacillus sp. BN09-2]MBU2776398.1 hypothetical protein [Acidithiobacillus sp. CV18-2]MBU2798561.1 hypothetical protein [Acidithiobacillus sp. VAN18-4]UTV82111.1 hypothetical protein MQE22_05700 [Acidithiobacillus sp. YTS05]
MKITQRLVTRSSVVTPQPSLSPTVVDILQVLEDRQELVHEQWRELLTDLQAESSEYSEKAIVLDAEISRYRRFLAILRSQVQERRIASSVIRSNPILL